MIEYVLVLDYFLLVMFQLNTLCLVIFKFIFKLRLNYDYNYCHSVSELLCLIMCSL